MLRNQELLLLGVPWKEPVLMLPNQKGAAHSNECCFFMDNRRFYTMCCLIVF